MNTRFHSNAVRRRAILALARTCWSIELDISVVKLGTFFDELGVAEEDDPNEHPIGWDEIATVILEVLSPEPALLPSAEEEISLPQVFNFASAARGQWMPGYQVYIVPHFAADNLFSVQGYLLAGIYQNKSTHLLGYVISLDAVPQLLAAKRMVVEAWYPCTDQEYEILFDRPGPHILQTIDYCREHLEEAGFCAL